MTTEDCESNVARQKDKKKTQTLEKLKSFILLLRKQKYR